MCANGECGHFNNPQDQESFTAQLEPILIKGKKLKLAIDADAMLDRVGTTQREEREELNHNLATQVAKNKIKLSAAIEKVEELAKRHKMATDHAINLYGAEMEKVVKGTALEGLFAASAKDHKPQAQIELTWARTLGIGIVHRHPDTLKSGSDSEPFTGDDVPQFIRDLGERLAAATGSTLAGIIAVPKG